MVRALSLSLLLASSLLAGCTIGPTREERYANALRAWKGQDINTLIRVMGPPERVFEMPDGNTMFTWSHNGPAVSSGFYYGGFATSTTQSRSCAISFTVSPGGEIARIISKGSDCSIPVAPKPEATASSAEAL